MASDVEAVTIGRWRLDWLVAVERGGDSAGARSMSDDVAAALPRCLKQLSITVPGDDHQAVVFIDQLVLDIDVGAAWDRDAVADQIARRVGQNLARTLAGGGAGGGVVRYRDRAEYLAQFLVDLAAGGAFDSWRYAEMEGLRVLAPGAAARTLAERDPTVFLEALRRLGDAALAAVAAVVSALDGHRILACYQAGKGSGTAGVDLDALEAVWAVVEAWPGFPLPAPGGRERLQAFARAARQRPDLTPAAIVGAVDALGDLVAAALAAEDGGGWPPAVSAPPARWAALRARVIAVRSEGARGARVQAAVVRSTPFGGALMLLGLLDDVRGLGLDLAALPDGDVYRLLLVACAHGARWQAVFDDPCLRDLLGVPPALDLAGAQAWAAGLPGGFAPLLSLEALAADLVERGVLDPDTSGPGDGEAFPAATCPALREGAATLLRAFAARLPGFQRSSPGFLRGQFLACAATVQADADHPGDLIAHLQSAPLDLVLRMTRLKALGFPAGGGQGRVTLREAAA
jgi:hypothetical protein